MKKKTISSSIRKYLTVTVLAVYAFAEKIWHLFQEHQQETTRALALRNNAIQNGQDAFSLANEISSFFQVTASTLSKYGIDSDAGLHIRILGAAGGLFLLAVPKKNLNQDFHPNQLSLIARRLNEDIARFKASQMMMYGQTFPGVFPFLHRGIQFTELVDNSVEIIIKVRVL